MRERRADGVGKGEGEYGWLGMRIKPAVRILTSIIYVVDKFLI